MPAPVSYCKGCEKYGIKTESITKEHERRSDGRGASETIVFCGYHWLELFKKMGYNIPMPTREQIETMERTADFRLDDFNTHEPPERNVDAMQNPWIEKNVFVSIDEKDIKFITEKSGPILTWSTRVALDARFMKGLHNVWLQVILSWINPLEKKAAVSITMSRDDISDLAKSLELLAPQIPVPISKFIHDSLEAWKAEPKYKLLG